MKKENKIVCPNLMAVAQEKYFYKQNRLTLQEEDILRKIIPELSSESLVDLNLAFLSLSTSYYKSGSPFSKKTQMDIDNTNEAQNKIEINFMEEIHSIIEGLGNKLLACKTIDDLKILEEQDELLMTILFLCFQYCRTRKMKNNALNLFQNEDSLIPRKFWNNICWTFALKLAVDIASHPDLRFVLLENNTSEPFLTSDQPIFNLFDYGIGQKEQIAELAFYYPLSPKVALLIHFKGKQMELFELLTLDEEMVSFLNKRVYEISDSFIFAHSKEQLKNYLNE